MLSVFVGQASAEAPTVPLVKHTPQELAVAIANKHNLNVGRFLGTIQCESNWDIEAVGDNGTSFGLAQLHHPERDWGITIEQAKIPEVALEIMADAWVKGEQGRWTCWRTLYK